MDDPAFVAELRDWIWFTPDQAPAGNDGLFSACSGNPVAPSWLAECLFAQFFKKKLKMTSTGVRSALQPGSRFL
jgi:hypothetical protein